MSMINQILDRISPIEMKKTRIKMLIAARIDDRIKELNINMTELSLKMNMNTSEFEILLSGCLDFTIDQLIDICDILNLQLDELVKDKVEEVMEIKMPSSYWARTLDCVILDPDGWDRNNFKYSFYEEEITLNEFNTRLLQSTIKRKLKKESD